MYFLGVVETDYQQHDKSSCQLCHPNMYMRYKQNITKQEHTVNAQQNLEEGKKRRNSKVPQMREIKAVNGSWCRQIKQYRGFLVLDICPDRSGVEFQCTYGDRGCGLGPFQNRSRTKTQACGLEAETTSLIVHRFFLSIQ